MASVKNLKIKLNFKYFKRHTGVVFWILLVFLIIGEAVVIKSSVDLIFIANQQPAEMPKKGGVSINFENYQEVSQRILDSKNYRPLPDNFRNPFFPRSPAELEAAAQESVSTSSPLTLP